MTAAPTFPQHGVSELDSNIRFSARSLRRVPSSSVDHSPASSSLNRTTSALAASFSSPVTLPPNISLPSFNSALEEDDFELPAYDVGCSSSSSSSDEADASHDSPTPTQHDMSPDFEYQTSDDSCIRREPTQQRDYLSRSWEPEDAVCTWRYVSSQKSDSDKDERLKNASWRAWHMSSYDVRPVPPSLLRWDKEKDVTWLYGPLQTHEDKPKERTYHAPSPSISVASSVTGKKSILKRKTISQTLLQHSLMTHSLLKCAGAIIKAQNACASSETSASQSDSAASLTSSSSVTSDSPSSRRVGFNQSVEQAVIIGTNDDFDDDDGILTMKPYARSGRVFAHRNSFSSDSTIVHLPHTTLKPSAESPPKRSTMQFPWFRSSSAFGSGPRHSISRSPSTETLRPAKHTSHDNFLLGEDDYEDEGVDRDTSWLKWGSEAAARFDSSWLGGNRPNGREEERQSMPYTRSSGVFAPFEEQGRDGRPADHVDADMDEDEEFRMNYGLFDSTSRGPYSPTPDSGNPGSGADPEPVVIRRSNSITRLASIDSRADEEEYDFVNDGREEGYEGDCDGDGDGSQDDDSRRITIVRPGDGTVDKEDVDLNGPPPPVPRPRTPFALLRDRLRKRIGMTPVLEGEEGF